MIDEEETFKRFGYRSIDLKPNSGKKIVAVCDVGGEVRELRKCYYHDLCHKCALQKLHKDPDWIINNKNGRKNGKTRRNPEINQFVKENTNKHLCECGCGGYIVILRDHYWSGIPKYIHGHNSCDRTEETQQKIIINLIGHEVKNVTREKISGSLMGHIVTKETRKRLSATQQNIPYDEWEDFARNSPYCPLFNETCRESNREKYDRKCFICGLPEEENITNTDKQKKLSVHHVDMNKQQGCDGIRWKLIPVCIHCHGKLHGDVWIERIKYLLKN